MTKSDKDPCPHGADVLVRAMEGKQEIKYTKDQLAISAMKVDKLGEEGAARVGGGEDFSLKQGQGVRK